MGYNVEAYIGPKFLYLHPWARLTASKYSARFKSIRGFTPVIYAERDWKPDLQTGVRLDCIDDSDVRSGREDGRIPVSRQTP